MEKSELTAQSIFKNWTCECSSWTMWSTFIEALDWMPSLQYL